jgi:hypothetical protein
MDALTEENLAVPGLGAKTRGDTVLAGMMTACGEMGAVSIIGRSNRFD